jgi:hypothetical protein
MNNLKRLAVTLVLILVFSLHGFAGETSCAPGEMNTPPCSGAPSEYSETPGQTETPSLSDSVDLYALAEIALERLLLF